MRFLVVERPGWWRGPARPPLLACIGDIVKDRADTEKWLKEDRTSYLATVDRRDFGGKKTLTLGRAADNDIRIDDPAVDVVITTGGTGFTGRDVTPEAVKPLFEKEVDGFSTVFHMISFQKVGTSTIQSRACAGLARGTYVFCLPGSPGACKDAWSEILKWQLDNRHRPCNFVEIMPRLEEHHRKG